MHTIMFSMETKHQFKFEDGRMDTYFHFKIPLEIIPQKGDFISFTSNNDDLPSWFTSDMSCHTSLKEKKEYEKFMWDILEEWGGIEIERRTFYPCSPYIRMDAKFWD